MAKTSGAAASKARARAAAKERDLSVPAVAAKKIYDSLRHVPSEAVDVVRDSNGRTGREAIEHDIQLVRDKKKKVKFGKIYYQQWRSTFVRENTMWDALAVDEADVTEISATLRKGLTDSMKTVPCRKALVSWCETAAKASKYEASCIFRAALGIRPKQDKGMAQAMQIISFIVRLELSTSMGDLVKCLSPWMETVFSESLKRTRAKKIDEFAWANENLEALSLIMPPDHLKKVLDCGKMWSTVAEEP